MREPSLALSFSDSLASNITDGIGEIVEVGLDTIMDEGILKEIPIVSTAISLYRFGDSIRERHHLKKLAVFIDQIRRSCPTEAKRQAYQEKFTSDAKFRNQELEYILILIDRFVSYDKPRMLARLYLAYLEGTIMWEEFTMYSEVVDRFLFLDCRTLTTESDRIIVPHNTGGEAVLRLVALGLMTEVTDYSSYKQQPNGHISMTWDTLQRSISPDRVYKRTEFGEQLASILR